MHKELFDKLAESMEQMGEIVRGERARPREFHVDAIKVKEVRSATGLSQAKVATLRNWEQDRRDPTGLAKALLRAIHNDPKHVLRALAE